MSIALTETPLVIANNDSPVMQASSLEFRKDINGLRAFAVMAVVLYHFELGGFLGGFAGVDVFFVISGFLMTGIIVTRLEKRTFSFVNFYLSRARRIIPALAALCLFLLSWGYYWLTPSDYKTLGEHAAAAITFVSNFVFKGEEGYFDAPMRDKWLLHTWSLSVEWQFYLIYPLLLAALYKDRNMNRRKLCIILTAIAAVTLMASAILSPIKASFSFYLLPTRIWEFIVGGIAWLTPASILMSGGRKKIVEAVGFICILASFFLFDHEIAWPGYVAALPVFGTFLVILAAREKSILTGNLFCQLAGKCSYSIYLWHWPVFVGLGYFSISLSAYSVIAIGISFLLGAVSYLLIETPFRQKVSSWSPRASMAAITLIVTAIAAMGLITLQLKGIPQRVSAEVQKIDSVTEDKYRAPKKCGFNRDDETLKRCTLGDRSIAPQFVLWGDSHAGAIASAVQAAAPGKSGLIYSFICPTIFNAHVRAKAKDACHKFNDLVLHDIRSLPKTVPVIIANRFSYYLHGLNEGIKRVHGLSYEDISDEELARDAAGIFKTKLVNSLCTIAKDRKVYVMKPVPEMGKNVPKTMARRLMTGTGDAEVSISRAAYAARHEDVLHALSIAQSKCGIELLDPVPYLCTKDKCAGAKNGRPIYFDDDHLNETGNKTLVPLLQRVFR